VQRGVEKFVVLVILRHKSCLNLEPLLHIAPEKKVTMFVCLTGNPAMGVPAPST